MQRDELAARGAPELLPCPFCGERAHVYNSQHFPSSDSIGCANESCAMQPATDYLPEPMAIAAWNRRATPAALAASPEVDAERAFWVRAIETYFDGPTVENVEAYVERFRAEAAAMRGKETT